MRQYALLIATIALILPGCGGGGGGGTSSSSGHALAVVITPPAVSLPPSGTQQFSATITNLPAAGVNWSVEQAGGGSVSATGFYQAPTTAGTYNVIASGQNGVNASGSAEVVVHVIVSVSPINPTMTLGQLEQFNATVVGSANQAVTWSIAEGAAGGTISPTGLYSPVGSGTFHITATSQLDHSEQATTTVTVTSGSATGTIQ